MWIFAREIDPLSRGTTWLNACALWSFCQVVSSLDWKTRILSVSEALWTSGTATKTQEMQNWKSTPFLVTKVLQMLNKDVSCLPLVRIFIVYVKAHWSFDSFLIRTSSALKYSFYLFLSISFPLLLSLLSYNILPNLFYLLTMRWVTAIIVVLKDVV